MLKGLWEEDPITGVFPSLDTTQIVCMPYLAAAVDFIYLSDNTSVYLILYGKTEGKQAISINKPHQFTFTEEIR